MAATYTKHKESGEWRIRCDDVNLKPGDVVRVELKSGQNKEDIVGNKIWEGTDKETGQPIALYGKFKKPLLVKHVCPHCGKEFDAADVADKKREETSETIRPEHYQQQPKPISAVMDQSEVPF